MGSFMTRPLSCPSACRSSLGWFALWCVLLLVGCRALGTAKSKERLCNAMSECEEGQVCHATGVCMDPPDTDVPAREETARFGDDEAGLELWRRYGTVGSMNVTAQSKDGHGYCGLEDVRTDDLMFHYTSWYPAGYWGAAPIHDGQSARCGDDLETLTWRLLNCERMTKGIPAVDCDLRLVWIGRQHATDMASRQFFGHVNPDGNDPFRRLSSRGISYGAAGENLARQRSILDAHHAWMDSSLHRRNMLTETYDYAGIGVVRSGHQLILSEAFVGGLSSADDYEPEFVPESRPVFPDRRPVLGTPPPEPPDEGAGEKAATPPRTP